MNYTQVIEYLFSQLPMFHRIGSAAYKADLNNTLAICALLGNPEKKFKSIHVAGTNGKGSTSHLLASIFQEAGYKTGLYTSPHLKDFRERIRINGEMIPEQEVINFVENFRADFDRIQPSFFEWTVGLAFDYFARQQVDIAIVEVGLGGRLDSTNVITPLLSVITNISYDHMQLLGDTLPKIAGEKAGIIKQGVPVVIGETQTEVKEVFVNKAKEQTTPIVFADAEEQVCLGEIVPGTPTLRRFEAKGRWPVDEAYSGLLGSYQRKNLATVLTAAHIFQHPDLKITETAILKGIQNVVRNTGLLGRWQILQQQPLMIADTGHNEAGIREVLEQITQTPHQQLHMVIGMVNDKDVRKVLSLLPKNAIYYFTKASIPRALPEQELQQAAQDVGLIGQCFPHVKEAMHAACNATNNNDLIFVGGSTFVVADALLD